MSETVPRLVRLGRGICGDFDAAVRREWLATNGLGGYAFGTVAGPTTRRYHGHLVAALEPPVARTVLVGPVREVVAIPPRFGRPARRVPLHAIERADGSFDGDGWRWLESFELDGMLPVWRYAIDDLVIEKRLWMPHERQTTIVRYALVRGEAPIELEVEPLLTARDHNDLRGGPRRTPPRTIEGPDLVAIELDAPSGPVDLALRAVSGRIAPRERREPARIRLAHREETARGEDDRSDAFAVGRALFSLEPGRTAALVISADPGGWVGDVEASLGEARERQAALIARASAAHAPAPIRQLVLAADQFLVRRRIPLGRGRSEEGRTVIAGYPWFNDWGRDTMIALPGLCAATGRLDEAHSILRLFARFLRRGLLPNDFPDAEDVEPAYHTADASLWFAIALDACSRASGDASLVEELLPTVRAIIDHHVAGTDFGIGVDPADGLVREGAEGYQLTWMDAKVGDWVVTPRRGKPVEIQALWINVLRLAADWLAARGEVDAARSYERLAERATGSFGERFWRPELGYLADVVDGPDGDDTALRPNQLLAVSLPHPLVQGDRARSVVAACGRALVTSGGLRSLSPDDPAYRSSFTGDRLARDAAYHQGTVWSWLIGPWVDAVIRVTDDRELAASFLAPLVDHLADAGLGSVSECFDPEPPHAPRACVAQAWGVAELLRALRRVSP